MSDPKTPTERFLTRKIADAVDPAGVIPRAVLADALRCRAVQRGTGRRCTLDAPHLGRRHEPEESDLDDASDDELERQARADDEFRGAS